MMWTTTKIAKLLELAPSGCGSAKIGEILGCSQQAVWTRAHDMKVAIKAPKRRSAPRSTLTLRARWATLLPTMKEQLRADIGSMNLCADLLAKQEPLGEEFERVLYDNLGELYVRS